MLTQKLQTAALFAAVALLAASSAGAAEEKQQVEQSTVVTVPPKQEAPGGIPVGALHLKVNGKETKITGFTPLHGPESTVELVVLIDDGARTSLGLQMNDVAKFVMAQHPDTKVTLAYMMNGQALLGGPLTTDHAAVLHSMHLPLPGGAGISGSPYFCLSDLAKRWPSNDIHARREVLMITDGVDYYDMHYDPEDPYVQSATDDAVRARLIVFSIYWSSSDRFDNSNYGSMDGQNLLAEVSQSTGGIAYWQGRGNPVDLTPYLDDLKRRFDSQYELDFMTAVGNKPEMQYIKLSASAHAKIDAPQQIYVHPNAE